LALGERLGKMAEPKDIYLLTGGLGAGKTVFAKGFAKGLNVSDHVVSPTFNILNIYSGRLNFYHFDLYRLEDCDELFNLGFDEYIYGNGVCLIEWPDKLKDSLKGARYTAISINKDLNLGENYRKITVENER
jgi:tRNA threonylcarbamoyladenosine biosynthesis protein TsaE